VADDDVRLVALGAQRRKHCQARRHESRLLYLGLDELRLGRLEANSDEIEP